MEMGQAYKIEYQNLVKLMGFKKIPQRNLLLTKMCNKNKTKYLILQKSKRFLKK